MRYRRIEYRFATVLATEQPGPIGGPWHCDRRDMVHLMPASAPGVSATPSGDGFAGRQADAPDRHPLMSRRTR